jgi:hypothetical protein
VSTVTTNSYAWACSTNGALSAEQRRAVKAAIRRGYREIGRGLLSWPLHRSKTDATLPGAPDSALARLAEEAAADQGPALAGHGYRTWVIGDALALHDGLSLDRELFYVASLLHDSGLLREVVGQDFTIRSARLVLDLCGQVETVDDATGLRLADAIVGHASPGLTVKDDELAFYVQAGAMADLAGLRMWDLPGAISPPPMRSTPRVTCTVPFPRSYDARRETSPRGDSPCCARRAWIAWSNFPPPAATVPRPRRPNRCEDRDPSSGPGISSNSSGQLSPQCEAPSMQAWSTRIPVQSGP